MKAVIAPVALILGTLLIILSFMWTKIQPPILDDKELEDYSAAVSTRELAAQGLVPEAEVQKSSDVANEKKLKLEAGLQSQKLGVILFRAAGVVIALAGGGYYLWIKSLED